MTEVREAFKNVIVEKAADVFSRYGYKKTTMEDIAAEVGKGKSSIYYYYKSKEEIFKAVVEHEAELVREQLLEEVNKATEPIDKIRNYVLGRMRHYKKVINFYKVLTNGLSVHLDFIYEIRENYHQQEIALVTEILNEGLLNNKFTIDEPELGAMAIVTALRGLEMPLSQNDDQNIEARLDKLLQFLFMGIVKR